MRHRQRPVLVTGAAISREEEFNARRRRYVWTMMLRVVLLIVAAIIVSHSVVAALVIGVLSAVLPWMAVIVANDGPPKSSRRYRPVDGERLRDRALEAEAGTSPEHRVITGTVIDADGPGQSGPPQGGTAT